MTNTANTNPTPTETSPTTAPASQIPGSKEDRTFLRYCCQSSPYYTHKLAFAAFINRTRINSPDPHNNGLAPEYPFS